MKINKIKKKHICKYMLMTSWIKISKCFLCLVSWTRHLGLSGASTLTIFNNFFRFFKAIQSSSSWKDVLIWCRPHLNRWPLPKEETRGARQLIGDERLFSPSAKLLCFYEMSKQQRQFMKYNNQIHLTNWADKSLHLLRRKAQWATFPSIELNGL